MTVEQSQRLMRTPRQVDVEITARCNLRCRYCYFFQNSAVVYQDLPTAQWLDFFAELGRCGVMEVTVAGGEPFMREDLPELLDGIVRNRMRYSILTNGGLITDDLAAHIKASGRCSQVQISVDGASAGPHDACRGRGAFAGAMRGIDLLKQHGVPVAVRVTIHRHNVHDLDNIAALLLDEIGLPGFSTNAAGYLGACRQNAGHVLLSVSERQEAMRTLARLAEQYPGRITAAAGPLCETRMWRQMEGARQGQAEPPAGGGYLSGCGCPTLRMAVRADGVMTPCTMLSHMALGRINQDRVVDVWQNAEGLNSLRGRRSTRLDSFDFCRGCEYVDYCTGNCPGLAFTLTEDVNHPSPDACLRRFLAAGGELV